MSDEVIQSKYELDVSDYVDGVKKVTSETEKLVEKTEDVGKETEKVKDKSKTSWAIVAVGINQALEIGKKFIDIMAGVVNKLIEFRDAADDHADAIAGMNLQLKNMGIYTDNLSDKLIKNAEALEKNSNYQSTAILEGTKMLLTFNNLGEDVLPSATQAMLDMSAVMKMDLTSSAQTIGKALQDPIDGLGLLSKQGFHFTEQQKAMIKEMVKANDILGAQGIILDEIDKAFSGHAALQKDSFDQLKNSWTSFKEVVGKEIQPWLDEWAENTKTAIQFFSDVVQLNQDIKNVAKGNFSNVSSDGLSKQVLIKQDEIDKLKERIEKINKQDVAYRDVYELSRLENEIGTREKIINKINEELDMRAKLSKQQDDENKAAQAKATKDAEAKAAIELKKENAKSSKEYFDDKKQVYNDAQQKYKIDIINADTQTEKDIADKRLDLATKIWEIEQETSKSIANAKTKEDIENIKKNSEEKIKGITNANDIEIATIQKNAEKKAEELKIIKSNYPTGKEEYGPITLEEYNKEQTSPPIGSKEQGAETPDEFKARMEKQKEEDLDYTIRLNTDIEARGDEQLQASLKSQQESAAENQRRDDRNTAARKKHIEEREKQDKKLKSLNEKMAKSYEDVRDVTTQALSDILLGEQKSLGEYALILADKLKMRLASVAAEATVSALWETAQGVAAYATGNVTSGSAHMAAAADYATTATAAGLGAFAAASASRGLHGAGYGNEEKQSTESTKETETESIQTASAKALEDKETIYISANDWKKMAFYNIDAINEALASGKSLKLKK